jgi:serine/threonine-protein kinase
MSDSETLPPGSVPIAIGEVLAGKYRVERILGVGGMGVVVQATHLQLDQRVALKFMLAPMLKNGPLIERFTREARAAVRLRSDHVARVLDVGTFETGSPYIVMEFLEGSDLGAVLERSGPLPIEAAADCLLQACDAVAEAHSLGIVHRDLKPKNLFLTYRNDGRPLVKVLDFGISKQKTGGDLSLTRTTEIIGSPNYMSPEQFRAARAADERSDIWALGVILYELLTGKMPFPAESVTQLTAMVLSDPPRPIQALRSNVPDELARVIERCMQKDPAARFQTVAQLALALQRFAPPDARDLAARIARIGTTGLRGGSSDASGALAGATGGGGTPAVWSEASTHTEPKASRPVATAIAAAVALVAVAVGVGARFVIVRPASPAAEAAAKVEHPVEMIEPDTTAAHTAVPVPPLATLAPPPEPVRPAATTTPQEPTAPTHVPSVPASTPKPTTAPTSVTPSGPGPVHAAPHGRPDAGSPDDGPRYRTNW